MKPEPARCLEPKNFTCQNKFSLAGFKTLNGLLGPHSSGRGRAPEPGSARRWARSGPLAAGMSLWLLACGLGEPRFGPGVAARIGRHEIAYSEFEDYVTRATGEQPGGLESAVLAALFEQFLEQQLLVRLAMERELLGGEDPPEAAARLLLGASPPAAVDEAAILEYYRAHSEGFRVGERVRLNQVLLQDRSLAESVRAELAAGSLFADVARRHSREASAVFVAEQDELERDDLPQALVEPIFALEPGETSEVLEAEYGFHVFQLVEKRPAETQPLARVRQEVRRRLEAEAADQKLAHLVATAKARYNVRVAERNLPFPFGELQGESEPQPSEIEN